MTASLLTKDALSKLPADLREHIIVENENVYGLTLHMSIGDFERLVAPHHMLDDMRGALTEADVRTAMREVRVISLVASMGDLSDAERSLLDRYRAFLVELETTRMTASFKMVLLEAFQQLKGWTNDVPLPDLARVSWEILHRRPPLLADLPENIRQLSGDASEWQRYWRKNPVNAWIGGNLTDKKSSFFNLSRASASNFADKIGGLFSEKNQF